MPTPTPPQQPVLRLDIFHVWTAEPDTPPEDADYHRVICTMADQLRAEREAATQGFSFKKRPLRGQSLMIHASMVRTGQFDGTHAELVDRVVQYLPDERVNGTDPDPDDDDDETAIHPTAASTS